MNRKQRRAQAVKERRAAWKRRDRDAEFKRLGDALTDTVFRASGSSLGKRVAAVLGPEFVGVTHVQVSSDDGSQASEPRIETMSVADYLRDVDAERERLDRALMDAFLTTGSLAIKVTE